MLIWRRFVSKCVWKLAAVLEFLSMRRLYNNTRFLSGVYIPTHGEVEVVSSF
jgi:hypothetical protein